jgi:hypothetical protein
MQERYESYRAPSIMRGTQENTLGDDTREIQPPRLVTEKRASQRSQSNAICHLLSKYTETPWILYCIEIIYNLALIDVLQANSRA